MIKIKKIPILRVVYRISNAYCYKGDMRFVMYTAPRHLWLSRIGKGVFISVFLSFLASVLNIFWGNDLYDPRKMVLGAFPSILGFGIGVFALLFALPKEFNQHLDSLGTDAQAKMLPADMAYPLMIYAISILLCGFFTIFGNYFLIYFLSGFLFYYGILVTFDLLSSIFSTAMFVFSSKK